MRQKNEQPVGWHSRGYLPHFDGGEIAQFVTFRLGDSAPTSVIERWKQELALEPEEIRDSLLRRRIETYLDQGYGACYLKDPKVGEKVESSILHFDGERYRMSAWVVMPNHTHMLLTPCAGYDLSGIMHSIKSYTANEVNRLLKRKGRFW
ncbi:MAG: transposase [Blastocatellales bacterium]